MSNLKPFNLPEALAGKAVMLRDGRTAYIRHHETELDAHANYRLLGYVADGDQLSWRESGEYYSEMSASRSDIVGMHPETRVTNGLEVPAPESTSLAKGKARITRIHLTPDTIFNERAFSIEVDDEGAGEYLVIRSLCPWAEDALAIEASEWPALRDAIDLMVKNVRVEA